MRVIHVTGARPNFPKMAPVERALRAFGVQQTIVHTGQHFDRNMSELFFEQLSIPKPHRNLGIGAGSHASQTAEIMKAIEPIFDSARPDVVVVYGDVNSTVGATLVASKMRIPVCHVEAGLRSGDRSMPEEINRLVVDSIADVLYTTCADASENLFNEGASASVVKFVGNPMIDSLLLHQPHFAANFPAEFEPLTEYALVTLHRPANVDSESDAVEMVGMLKTLSDRIPLVFPIHPRSRKSLDAHGLGELTNVNVVDPMGYLQFMATMERSRLVITDSGGVQEETTMLRVPCFTVRPNTERPVTITEGTNQLVTRTSVLAAVEEELASPKPYAGPPELWDGRAGERIAEDMFGRFG